MKTYGLSQEQLAMVSVVRREWAAKNPRATFKTPKGIPIARGDAGIPTRASLPFDRQNQRCLPRPPERSHKAASCT
jgi:acetyl-CoA acetyltransferase